jgi:hypothetical protein
LNSEIKRRQDIMIATFLKDCNNMVRLYSLDIPFKGNNYVVVSVNSGETLVFASNEKGEIVDLYELFGRRPQGNKMWIMDPEIFKMMGYEIRGYVSRRKVRELRTKKEEK